MTDRLGEQGAIQYAQNNPTSAGVSRLGGAGALQAAIADALSNGRSSLNGSRLGGKGRIYALAAGAGPMFLFNNSEVGVWYDPSDFLTLFQDNAGTTPVSAVGQTVGLMLDKSKGLVLGSELVTNGTFDSSTTGWSAVNSSLASVSGQLVVTNTGSFGSARQTLTTVVGNTYVVEFDIIGGTSPLIRIAQAANTDATSGNKIHFVATQTNPSLQLFCNSATIGLSATFDNISVRELPGYHATQATSTARPILARHPIGGRRNLLTYTEDFSNAAWVLLGTTTKTPNYGIAPDGTQTATRIVIGTTTGDGFQQLYSTTAGANASYTAGIWIKSTSGSSQSVRLKNTHAGVLDNFLNVTATATWQFVSLSVTNGATAGTGQYIGVQNDLTALAKDILVWHPDLEFGLSPTAYQKVVSTYDVTEAGVNDAYYLKFDGVDDFMVTPSIDFSGTDKMSVFAGVRRLGSVLGIACELSSGNLAGSFYLAVPYSGSQELGFSLKGATTSSGYVVDNLSTPSTESISCLFDIGGSTLADEIKPRVNGAIPTLVTLAAGPADTANLGNYPLYIGMRAGTSLPFNGHLYSLVVRGALSDASQISAAESFVNSRTGAY